ncbi:MAG: ABC transporter ATP-binding protein [Kiritimatiellae bacterium]|nr:ABC transporter ATP-binding protein [Kiritimatiellia bacterium]
MALLEVRNIRHCFGGLVALDRVSFNVQKGTTKAVIGPNGAGKTTLFNIISGAIRPDTGTVSFRGVDITGRKPHRIARVGLARTFQAPSLFLRMTALENVMVGRHCRTRAGFAPCALRLPRQGREERAIREKAMSHLERVGLAAAADIPVGSLSFGQRRMVELARALASEPQLLLLDEPAAGLNTKETDDLADLISRLLRDEITVLLVEHDMSLVMDISQDILVLHFGTPIAEGPPADVRNDERVVSVYLGGALDHAAG